MDNPFPFHTDIEELQIMSFYHKAIIPFHDYVILAVWHGWSPGCYFSFAIYRSASVPVQIDTPLSLLSASVHTFDDMGDAVKAAFREIEKNKKEGA